MMAFLFSVWIWICVALLFSLAIFIHEFGHFLAARWLGLQVDAFAIGFGPAVWKKTVKGTEYKICCIPFGGYVALPQLDPSGMETVQGTQPGAKTEEERQLPDIAPWKRIVVALAGPFGNVVLAVVLAYLIFFIPSAKTGVVETTIGSVSEDSAAWQAGLRPGDRIETVNGKRIGNWMDLQVEYQLAGESGHALFGILRGKTLSEMDLTFQTNNILNLRVLSGVYPETTCVVAEIRPGSPAETGGLKVQDEILAVGNVPVLGALHFSTLIKEHGAVPAVLTINRGKRQLSISVTPRYSEEAKRLLIGIVPSDKIERVRAWMMYRDPWLQLKWDSMSVVRVLQALVAPESKGERTAVAKNIGGPVAILMGLYNIVRDDMVDALGFLRMICVNLAILNLLPIPVLDGGHILFALFSIVTRRKPHPKVVAVLVNGFAIVLMGLMALLVYTDIAKRVKYNKALHAQEREEAAAAAAATNAPAKP